MRLVARTLAACVAACLSLGSVGCGGGKGTVSGSVTLDGQPVSTGTVSFIPAQGSAVVGVIRDGKYTVKDVPAGEAKVIVQTPKFGAQAGAAGGVKPSSYTLPPGAKVEGLPPEAVAEIERRKEMAGGPPKSGDGAAKPVPDKYGDPATSGLTTTVKGGQNTYDIPLTTK